MTEALDDADGEVDGVLVPEVPAALAPAGLVFRMNFALEAPLLVVPEVPVVPGVLLGDVLERSMHPVTVTLSAALELGVCELGGVVCAATAIAIVHTIAAMNPMLLVIVPS